MKRSVIDAARDEGFALRSASLARAGFAHAFFTRRGGRSPLPWGPTNFAASVGDDPANVRANVELAARALGVEPSRVYFLSQVHGADAVEISGEEDRDEVVLRRGDVVISNAPGVACGVRSADCVPVLVGDPRTGIVAAIHAGWRGVAIGAVAATIRRLVARRARPTDLVAAIGPHIEACCFEVGDDVAAELARASSLGERAIRRDRGPRPHVDLRSIVHAQLDATGVARDRIDDVPGCTACDAERFHSFRRDRDRSGRMLSAIVTASGLEERTGRPA